MAEEYLKKLQSILCSMLVDFDKYFSRYDIKYSLASGNLLGAIRHNGFIPWDDDMDIMMDRVNYNKFFLCWQKDKIKGYEIEFEGSFKTGLNHTKIYKDGTVLSSKNEMKLNVNHGIWIDLFVYDKVPLNNKAYKKVMHDIKLKIALTRHKIYKKGTIIQCVLSIILYLFPKFLRIKLINKYNRNIYSYMNLEKDYVYKASFVPNLLHLNYPMNLFDEYIPHLYETEYFMITKQFDICLETEYGNYMQLPPLEKRVAPHKPDIIDFGD